MHGMLRPAMLTPVLPIPCLKLGMMLHSAQLQGKEPMWHCIAPSAVQSSSRHHHQKLTLLDYPVLVRSSTI